MYVTYASKSMVIERLVPNPSERLEFENIYGADIESKLQAADAFIDAMLQGYVDVPLNDPPRILMEAAADCAAALFLFDRKDVESARELMARCEKLVEVFRSRFRYFGLAGATE
ncbi:MAG: phage protein Gp36 family protein [Nitrososphaerota archaeon]